MKKGAKIKSDYLDYDLALNKAKELMKYDKSKIMGLYIIVSINTGLRIGDVIQLSWEQLRLDSFKITEQKTGKERIIKINDKISSAVAMFDNTKGIVFKSQKGSIYSRQQLNRKLKQVFGRQVKNGNNISSHSLRKTFGRRVWNNLDCSDSALIVLSELFNHVSLKVTRQYLGIRQEELNDVYMSL